MKFKRVLRRTCNSFMHLRLHSPSQTVMPQSGASHFLLAFSLQYKHPPKPGRVSCPKTSVPCLLYRSPDHDSKQMIVADVFPLLYLVCSTTHHRFACQSASIRIPCSRQALESTQGCFMYGAPSLWTYAQPTATSARSLRSTPVIQQPAQTKFFPNGES